VNAIIFDLDGVLIDSEPIWDSVKIDLVHERGGIWTASASADMMGMSPREWPIYMRHNLGLYEMTEEDIAQSVIHGVRKRYAERLPLIPGAREAVIRLASIWPLGLASSSSRSLIDLVLEVSGLRSCFSVVVASEEVERGKPAPDVYIEACQRLNFRPECIVAVEDSASGIVSAKSAGLRVIAIPNASYMPNYKVLAQADLVLGGISNLSREKVMSALGRGAAKSHGSLLLVNSRAPGRILSIQCRRTRGRAPGWLRPLELAWRSPGP
jgi:HAD superfamily hydrolase (TIGR01509 family)